MATPLAAFGPGVVILTRTDTTTPLAINVGSAQEFTLDVTGNTKGLYGTQQFALAVARGTIKVTGKIKAALLSGIAWNSCFFGDTFTAGYDHYFLNEAHTVASTTQVVTNVTGGIVDLGVTYASNGLPLQRVATVSAAGTYSVVQSTGTYTFNVADGERPAAQRRPAADRRQSDLPARLLHQPQPALDQAVRRPPVRVRCQQTDDRLETRGFHHA